MASKYDSIWINLKAITDCPNTPIHKKEIKVAIPPALQKRVIKGVIHCKDNDTARKLEMADKRKKEKITYKRESALVTIRLQQFENLKGIQLGEL